MLSWIRCRAGDSRHREVEVVSMVEPVDTVTVVTPMRDAKSGAPEWGCGELRKGRRRPGAARIWSDLIRSLRLARARGQGTF